MNIIDRVLGLIDSVQCISCGRDGEALCVNCQQEYSRSAVSSCYRCNVVTDDFLTCERCWRTSPLRRVWVASEYNQTIAQLVQRYKYEQSRHAVTSIASLMEELLPHVDDSYIFVAAPTATRHVRERGFDHAELLARELARRVNGRFVPALKRITQTQQVGARRQQRKQQMTSEAFRVRHAGLIAGKRVILVDDVITTGATLEAAATCLKQAGVKSVEGVVLGRG